MAAGVKPHVAVKGLYTVDVRNAGSAKGGKHAETRAHHARILHLVLPVLRVVGLPLVQPLLFRHFILFLGAKSENNAKANKVRN